MRMNQRALIATLVLTAFASSCATYRTYTVPETPTEAYSSALTGKTLTILPFEIRFENSRGLTTGVEYLKIGGKYTKRYAAEEDNLDLRARVGVLQRNILKKLGTDAASLSRISAEILKKGALGQEDYSVAYMKGLGSGKSGMLSNRPISLDASTATVTFLPAEGATSYFSAVRLAGEPGATTADYYLEGDIGLDNEILHILSAPGPMGGKPEHYPALGDYYVSIRAFVTFKLYDAKTGDVVATQKTKLEFPVAPGAKGMYYLPLSNPDDYYELDSFLSLDYSKYALKAVEEATISMLPFIAPYIANVSYIEKVEE